MTGRRSAFRKIVSWIERIPQLWRIDANFSKFLYNLLLAIYNRSVQVIQWVFQVLLEIIDWLGLTNKMNQILTYMPALSYTDEIFLSLAADSTCCAWMKKLAEALRVVPERLKKVLFVHIASEGSWMMNDRYTTRSCPYSAL